MTSRERSRQKGKSGGGVVVRLQKIGGRGTLSNRVFNIYINIYTYIYRYIYIYILIEQALECLDSHSFLYRPPSEPIAVTLPS